MLRITFLLQVISAVLNKLRIVTVLITMERKEDVFRVGTTRFDSIGFDAIRFDSAIGACTLVVAQHCLRWFVFFDYETNMF